MTTAVTTTTKARAARAVVKPAVATAPKTAAKTTTAAKVAPKTVPKVATKATALSLSAGLAVLIAYPKLNKALKYHSEVTGCLKELEQEPAKDGTTATKAKCMGLTAYGANKWNVERVSRNQELFQRVATFVKRGGPVPSFWSNHPPVEVAKGVQFPNPIYWGGFSTSEMRLAFAAIWAK
jgi:hypothetical protein